MQELQHALDRGAKIYAEVRGYGMSGGYLWGPFYLFAFSSISFPDLQRLFVIMSEQLMSDVLIAGDAHHITQPSQEGRGAYLAMNRALQQVCLNSHIPGLFSLNKVIL